MLCLSDFVGFRVFGSSGFVGVSWLFSIDFGPGGLILLGYLAECVPCGFGCVCFGL